MSKELIGSAQSAADVDRGADDSARLPVVAWWLKNSGGEKDIVGLGSAEHIYQGVYDEKIFLCRITDAQAQLAQKDARIAQLAAHARGKNKALANALKEIERLKRTIETGLDNELALVGERTELRAQLEQLQAAAERVVVLPERMPLPELPDYVGRPANYAKAFDRAVAHNACLDEFARLSQNPAAQPVADEREAKPLYLECRQCDVCKHVGINDAADGKAACHSCEWTGDEPVDDICPGCGSENVMAAACPECGGRYVLIASYEHSIAALSPATADSDVREVKP